MNIINRQINRKFLILFSVVILYGTIILYFDLEKISASFFSIEFSYIPIIILFVIISIFIKSERQRFLLKLISINISIKDSFIIFTAGQSLIITPGGAGSVIKSEFFKRRFGYPLSKTLPVILTERFLDLVGILSIIIIFLLFEYTDEFVIPIFLIGILLIVIYIAIRNKTLFYKFLNLLKKIKIFSKFLVGIEESYESIQHLTARKSLRVLWPFSILGWFIDAIVLYLCFLAFFLNFNLLEATLIGFTAFLLGIISLLPGGLGITEFSMIGFLGERGVNLSTATGLVLFNRLISIWFSTFLGFAFAKFALTKKAL